MDEKLEPLSENTVNVADNARDVLQSDYLGQSGRASVILICNTLLQTSNAVNADIFITGLDGHAAYCKGRAAIRHGALHRQLHRA